MSKRAKALARRFAEANRELIATVEAIPKDRWRAYCSAEQWTVGVVAHHVASDHLILADVTGAIVSGDAPAITWEMLHQINAEHLEAHRDCTQAETLELLRSGGEKVASTLRALSDADLERTAVLPFLGERPVTAEQFIEQAVIGHIGMHLPSIQAVLASEERLAASN